MIKNDPLRRQSRMVLIVFGCLIPLLIIDLVIQLVGQASSHTYTAFSISTIIEMVSLGIACVGLAFGGFVTYHFWKSIESRRTRALQGDQTLLAREQPVANEAALPLPTSIALRFKTRAFLFVLLVPLLLVVVIFFFIGLALGMGHSTTTAGHSSSITAIVLVVILGIFALIVIAAFSVTFIIIKKFLRYQVDVTEDGITGHFYGQTTSMRWQDARFFAISGVNKPRRPKFYELSNEKMVVRWIWLPSNMYFFYLFVPTTSYEEYHQRMQSLLELIEAKTHLPLYDLTETTNKWYL